MALKRTNRKPAKDKSPLSSSNSKKNTTSKSGLIGIGIALVCLLLIFEVMNLFNAMEAGKDIVVQVVGQFSGSSQPCGKFGAWDVAALGSDKIGVTDQMNGRVLFFDHSGKFIKSWGTKGEGPGDLKEPSGMTSDDKGNVYFLDAWKSPPIHGFNSQLKPILTMSLGSGFYGPRGLAFYNDNFYVADTGSHRVVRVSPKGETISSWSGDKQGDGKNEFSSPRSLKVDSKGNMFVADCDNNRVQILDSTGQFIGLIKAGNKVTDVAIDSTGRLFVSSTDGNFVKVYNPDGKYLGQLKPPPGSDGLFQGVSGMNFTPDGVLLLAADDTISMIRIP